jgi:ketose-bisphosphate aldolase
MSSLVPFSKGVNTNARVFKSGYTLRNLNDMLRVADEHGFGVPACNARSRWIAEAILDAAWQMKSPIIVEIAESEVGYTNMQPEILSEIVHNGIEERISKFGYSVPVCLHHDHIQKDVDGCIERSINAGFSSCEVDLSKQPIEDNIKKSKEVAAKLHPLGMSLEVEEGEIGSAAALADPEVEKNIDKYYTKAEDAVKLAEAVKPDALAFFVGNGHGVYLTAPIIGFYRIKEICDQIRKLGVYGVLHGGTGISPEAFKKAIEAGARKFNYATALSDIWYKYFPDALLEAMDKTSKEKGKPIRKVQNLFEDEIAKLYHEEAKMEIVEHLKFMFEHAFLCNGKSDLYI